MSRINRIRAHYAHRIDREAEHWRILDWASPETQLVRFKVLCDSVDLDGRSLLDVGCGLGDLWDYLKSREIAAAYTGVDLLPEMVAKASARHPEARFVTGDVFGAHNPFPPESFDVAFCSGIFNLNLGNNADFLGDAIERLLELAGEAAVFNLLHARAAGRDRTYAYYRPETIRELTAGLPCDCRIIDDYLFNDFTVICRKHAGQ